MPLVLDLFHVVAHFEEPQILVAQFLAVANLFRVPWPTLRGSNIFVAHFDYVCDVIITKLLGLSSELMAAEVNSKKGYCLPGAEDGQSAIGIGVELQRKIRSLRLQFMGAGGMAVHMY